MRDAICGALSFCLLTLLAMEIKAADGAEPARVDFGKQVRPIFAERCYECHGPENQEGNLRLDRRVDAQRGGDSGSLFTRDGEASNLLIERLESKDENERMPLGKKPLSKAEINVLKLWIEQGAEWPDAWSGDAQATAMAHWSFRAPLPPALPAVRATEFLRNRIDSFVVARLEREGLQPSREADRYTLIRRVYFDLIGLPPTPEEADAFANDPRPDAYERLVDRLLASNHYGERWARRWLDLARYADTNGYEKDRPRSIWPYRDWVVRALNADMPFDQFSLRQLAGDLLPGSSIDDRIATGFHRNTMQNEEGGIDPLEFRYYSVVDRINTTSTIWLGLTVGCAQCHSHKYDPLPHREYYQLLAFLNNCDEVDLMVPDAATDQRRREIEERIAQLTADLPKRFSSKAADAANGSSSKESAPEVTLEQSFDEWCKAESARAANWQVLQPVEAKSNLPLLTILPDGSVLASGDQTKSDVYDLKFRIQESRVTAIRLEALPHESLPLNGPGRAYYEGPKGDFFLSEFRASTPERALKFKDASHDFSKLSIGGGANGAQLTFDGDTTTGWSTSGREGEPHAAVYRLAEPTDLNGEFSLCVQMVFERHFSCGLGRFRLSITTDENATAAHGHSSEMEAILAKTPEQRSDADRKKLMQRFLEVAPQLAEARKEIEKLRESLPKRVTSLAFEERPGNHRRETHLHYRGEFLQPKQTVEANVPEFLPPLDQDARRDRLAFAQWLVSSKNPLTARVTVNRHWQSFFGRGLVRTVEDFGIQGELPSHPELLDWLAIVFARGEVRDSGEQAETAWSIKRLHRLIVTSATYRQSSRLSDELVQRDPQNVHLARGPRVRLEAEMVRDSALHAAGLLSSKMGGPGVFPPQPASITTEGTYGAFPWKPSPGEDRYRRSLYTFMKRTAPFAMYATFDAPSGEACLARRETSNSPLQALTLLNDTVFMEAAQALGPLTADQAGADREKAEWLFRRCLTRPPSDADMTALLAFINQQKARFASGSLDARKFVPNSDSNAIESATWTIAARALLNLDEAVTKR